METAALPSRASNPLLFRLRPSTDSPLRPPPAICLTAETRAVLRLVVLEEKEGRSTSKRVTTCLVSIPSSGLSEVRLVRMGRETS